MPRITRCIHCNDSYIPKSRKDYYSVCPTCTLTAENKKLREERDSWKRLFCGLSSVAENCKDSGGPCRSVWDQMVKDEVDGGDEVDVLDYTLLKELDGG